VDAHGIDPKEQIITKEALCNHVVKVLVGRRNESEIAGLFFDCADRPELFLL
jgi:hypothetical protein